MCPYMPSDLSRFWVNSLVHSMGIHESHPHFVIKNSYKRKSPIYIYSIFLGFIINQFDKDNIVGHLGANTLKGARNHFW
jgi:hypothetical protein